ncbi:MAG: M48 family metallopeptidase [Deltaproteobacteria bacterium]|nr:M48 family metallopeptidase [Deltaproteobacteria bacterium]
MEYTGYYHDGQTSARQPVRVTLENTALTVYALDGGLICRFSYQGLYLSEDVFPGQPVRLRHHEAGEAALIVEDDRILETLHLRAGKSMGGWGRHFSGLRGLAVLLSGVVVASGLVLWALNMAVPHLTVLVPESWERQLGALVVEQMAGEKGFCTGEEAAEILSGLAGRLLEGAETPGNFRVRIARDPMVNAFAAPGGEVVFMKGIIDEFQSPEELAAVLSHEMAHGLNRHPTGKLLRVIGLKLFFNATLGDVSGLAGTAGQITEVLVLNAYGREDELEADLLGVEMLNRAGIRGDGLVTLLERLGQQGGNASGLPRLLATHPGHGERIDRLKGMASATGAALTPEQWQLVRQSCGGGGG